MLHFAPNRRLLCFVQEQEDSKEADAVAFKNRLVGYDRNAAQRTQVIDDQSDYFEIDSNTWLSKEVLSVVITVCRRNSCLDPTLCGTRQLDQLESM